MQAFATKVKRLADGTVKFFLRLEDPELGEPVVVSGSAYQGDIFLVEKVEKAPQTAKIAVPKPIVEMSPSLAS